MMYKSTEKLSEKESMSADTAQVAHFRKVAFLAVALGTMTMFGCVIGLPMAYTYIQRVQSNMALEIDFCRVSYLVVHSC